MAVKLDISAFKRVPWGGASGYADLPVVGVDWSAAAFKMDIRICPGDATTPLVSLTNATAGSQGISATYDAGYVMPDGEVVGATIIRPQIDEPTLEALALSARASDPVALSYDLHITPAGGVKSVVCFGAFTILPGVTI